jgi:hypothetical protein
VLQCGQLWQSVASQQKHICVWNTIIRAMSPELITLMMESASTSEMSVNFYQTTWRCNPEDSHVNIQSSLVPEPYQQWF